MEYKIPQMGRVRISVNENCNLRCIYCNKEGQFTKRCSVSPEERMNLMEEFIKYGVDEIKFSGGEPLLYSDLINLVKRARELGVPKLSLTTNGILLAEKIKELESAGLDEVSISLDTLSPDIFAELTRKNPVLLEKVKQGIEAARSSNIPIKSINVVLTKYNRDIEEMITYATQMKMPLRLISYLRIKEPDGSFGPDLTVDTYKVAKFIESLSSKKSADATKTRQPYTDYKVNGTTVTLIDGLCPDCEQCGEKYAIRMTADGKLKPCLISEIGEIDIATPLREKDYVGVDRRIKKSILLKREGFMKYTRAPNLVCTKSYLAPIEVPEVIEC